MSQIDKVVVIGLDCAEPSLMFERWFDLLPNIRRLTQHGTYGPLTSSLPPITVPAWMCMACSKDPGTLGVYGFRNRKDHSYDGLNIATSLMFKEPRIWDLLSQRSMDSIVLGVPGTYPITRPIRGSMVTSFLTPGVDSDYTHPKSLKQEIAQTVGEYVIDVKGFRTDDKQWLLDQIYDMTNKRFAVAKMLLESKPWDLFWMVEMGHDRIHHGFWQFMDSTHHRYEADNPFEHAIRDYYVHTDKLIGELLAGLDLDRTAVWVVSDHGAKCMVGGFCFNEWLMEEGYLVLKEPASDVIRFSFDMVDWSQTTAWGEGGYYGRCFLNVQGREPCGVVPPEHYETVRGELQRKLEAVLDHNGQPMGTRAYKPQDIYRQVNRVAPDLVVIFGDLRWRSVGSVGHGRVYTFENDTGPDDANHAQEGLYLFSHPSLAAKGFTPGATIYDVTPTILAMLGEDIPTDMVGSSLVG